MSASRLQDALRHAEDGWDVIPVYPVGPDGTCHCPDGKRCSKAGKHPRGNGWSGRARMDADAITTHWTKHPNDNIGGRTGAASDRWVLDIDPDNGGGDTLTALVAKHGALPVTRTHLTGSKGQHLVFRMPADFEPTNSPGRLPPGIDVRGTGGQVVLPGSASGKGEYYVDDDAPIADPPVWLLGYIRPKRGEAPWVAAADLPEREEFTPHQLARLDGYVTSALRSITETLGGLQEGDRDQGTFNAACDLIEWANTPWADYSYEQAGAEAAALAPISEGFSRREAEKCWRSAAKRVIGKGRPLPEFTKGDDWDAPEPTTAPAEPADDRQVVPDDRPWERYMPDGELRQRMTPYAMWDREILLAFRVYEQEVAAEAKAEVAARAGGTASEAAVDAFAASVIPETELEDRPGLEWLVENWLYRDSVARVIGAGGTFKTFLMISVASCVARGVPWFGNETKGGPVVYIMAESVAGAKGRFEAHRLRHTLAPTADLIVVDRPVQMDGPEWPALVAYCERIEAVMVVIDTQAKATVGLEENSARDTGLWVGAAEHLRRTTGACVVLLHHTGHGESERGRGSSAAYAGVDTEILVRKAKGLMIEFKPIRQKEAGLSSWQRLKLVPSGTSLAVVNLDASDAKDPEGDRLAEIASLDRTQLEGQEHAVAAARVLGVLAGGGNGITKAELRTAYEGKRRDLGLLENGKRVPAQTWTDTVKRLEARGWLEYRPKSTTAFVLSEVGCAEVGVRYAEPAWADHGG